MGGEIPHAQNFREYSDACGVVRRTRRNRGFHFKGAPGTQLSGADNAE